MQPLQYDLRDPAAKDNSITHAATARSNLDAAITMRSTVTELQNTIELRATTSETAAPKPDLDAKAKKRRCSGSFYKKNKRKITSAKIAKICDLPPQRQETHRTTHTGTTTRCKIHRRNRLNSKRSKPQPQHRRGTFHRRLQPLYTEKYKVSCSGFLPTT